MKRKDVFKMCCCALFAAIICVSVIAIPIPLPGNGYFNLGDCFIIVASLCIGPLWGGLAGAVGASLSDFILGYTYYVPATFVIKWLMSVAAYFVFKAIVAKNGKLTTVALLTSSVIAELVMVGGYFLFEIPLYGIAVALADIVGNAVQGACGVVAATVVYTVLHKTGVVRKLFSK